MALTATWWQTYQRIGVLATNSRTERLIIHREECLNSCLAITVLRTPIEWY
jgi:hypothetical protein